MLSFETNRLRLLPMKKEDAIWIKSLNDDPDVLGFTADVPFNSIKETEHWIKHQNRFIEKDILLFTVLLKDTNDPIGYCGLRFTPEYNELDLTHRYFKKFWNNGYATEAFNALLDYVRSKNFENVIAYIREDHAIGAHVMERCGMQYIGKYYCLEKMWITYKL